MQIRNCAWAGVAGTANSRAVWARAGVIACQCPKSIITAQSLSYVEQFRIWKELGGGTPLSIEAKAAEAILVLEQAWRRENEHGQN